jgi:hypothetical protein
VRLWSSSSSNGQQRQFVLRPPLQLKPPAANHEPHCSQKPPPQQPQQQQQLSRLPTGEFNSGSCSSSITRTAGGSVMKRPPPCEAQTWLVMEYCNGG